MKKPNVIKDVSTVDSVITISVSGGGVAKPRPINTVSAPKN